MRRLVTGALTFGFCTAVFAEPSAQEVAKMKTQLMKDTQVVAQMGISVPIKDFKSDGNAKTLQIIFLDKEEPGMNTVSDDGEVIFLFEASDATLSELIGKAFEIRAKRELQSHG